MATEPGLYESGSMSVMTSFEAMPGLSAMHSHAFLLPAECPMSTGASRPRLRTTSRVSVM